LRVPELHNQGQYREGQRFQYICTLFAGNRGMWGDFGHTVSTGEVASESFVTEKTPHLSTQLVKVTPQLHHSLTSSLIIDPIIYAGIPTDYSYDG
jgi:hypothetical protein